MCAADAPGHNVPERQVGVLGATSLVGVSLIPLLSAQGWRVTAYSRTRPPRLAADVEWRRAGDPTLAAPGAPLPNWISLAPLWVLPDYYERLAAAGARRIVALSSTSASTKAESNDPDERATARRLVAGEASLRAWAERAGVQWTILRPTLIYGHGLDRNVSEIARFVARFGFFPVLGAAGGLRQPVHAGDVAQACIASLEQAGAANRSYDVSGGETLSYRRMVERVFGAMGRRPRVAPVPIVAFRVATACLRRLPRYRRWSAAMAERMNRDLVFDHGDAARDLGFAPRAFHLGPDDLPGSPSPAVPILARPRSRSS